MPVDPREFDLRVLESIDPICAQIQPSDLDLATPCPGWDLRALLVHMVAAHNGFAAAARLEPAVAATWELASLDPDPVSAYRASAVAVTSAFAGLTDQKIQIWGYGTLPARIAIHMHAVDFLAHGWDVARTIGVDSTLDASLCEHGLRIAQAWPEAAFTTGDPFGPHLPIDEAAQADHRLMAYLGRNPSI